MVPRVFTPSPLTNSFPAVCDPTGVNSIMVNIDRRIRALCRQIVSSLGSVIKFLKICVTVLAFILLHSMIEKIIFRKKGRFRNVKKLCDE